MKLAKLLVIPILALLLTPAGESPVRAGDLGQVYHNNPVAATVDGQPIRLDDLKNAKIQEMLTQAHEMQKRILKQKVIARLRQNHPELDRLQPPKISAEEVSQFYNSTPGVRDLGSMEQMREEIRRYLEDISRDTFLEAQYQLAIERGWVVDYLEPPNDFVTVASIGTAALWFPRETSPQKRVFVLEYSDFQCPFCKRVQKTLRKLRVKYADKVQFGFRHFPLPSHKEASWLAEAAECARDQSRFWELQNLLFNAAPAKISKKDLAKFAEQANIKGVDVFQACVNQGRHKERIAADIKEGGQLGIQGTPTFIVGFYDHSAEVVKGEMFSGALSEENFAEKIDKYLSMTGGEAQPATASGMGTND